MCAPRRGRVAPEFECIRHIIRRGINLVEDRHLLRARRGCPGNTLRLAHAKELVEIQTLTQQPAQFNMSAVTAALHWVCKRFCHTLSNKLKHRANDQTNDPAPKVDWSEACPTHLEPQVR